jgi:hypothetical protein
MNQGNCGSNVYVASYHATLYHWKGTKINVAQELINEFSVKHLNSGSCSVA